MQQSSEKYILKPHQTYYQVFLSLPGKQYKPERKIGEYLPKLKAYFKKVSANQIYRKFNSVGFCYDFISNFGQDNFQLVYIQIKNTFLYTSRNSILKHGKFELHAKNNLDLQIHMPLKFFKPTMEEALAESGLIELVLKRERSKPSIKTNSIEIDPKQTDLFGNAEEVKVPA